MMARQHEYEALMAFLGYAAPSESPACFEAHKRVVRVLDGLERDPRIPPVGPEVLLWGNEFNGCW
jgi:hypothetical protein